MKPSLGRRLRSAGPAPRQRLRGPRHHPPRRTLTRTRRRTSARCRGRHQGRGSARWQPARSSGTIARSTWRGPPCIWTACGRTRAWWRRSCASAADGTAPGVIGICCNEASPSCSTRSRPAHGGGHGRPAEAVGDRGGPGTGKTSTVARVLALLEAQAAAAGQRPPLVALAAPTGKAAARLEDAVRQGAGAIATDQEWQDRLQALSGKTVHRLLGFNPGNRTRFRHHRLNRLPHDVIVVDETSMVSLSLMARLLEAVRRDARLMLVGDPEQLASVEAGAVLGDIVGPADVRLRHAPGSPAGVGRGHGSVGSRRRGNEGRPVREGDRRAAQCAPPRRGDRRTRPGRPAGRPRRGDGHPPGGRFERPVDRHRCGRVSPPKMCWATCVGSRSTRAAP